MVADDNGVSDQSSRLKQAKVNLSTKVFSQPTKAVRRQILEGKNCHTLEKVAMVETTAMHGQISGENGVSWWFWSLGRNLVQAGEATRGLYRR